VRGFEERRAWDMRSCDNLFKALKLNLTSDNAVRFCRRVGEKGEGPRPLIVGFKREWQKEDVLERAKDLRNTQFSEVVIIPDLTKEQRKEEADMLAEVEKRNGELSREDRSKNLEWMVVGARGERRIVKGTVRQTDRQRRGGQTASRGGARLASPQLLPARPGPATWDPATGGQGASASGARGGRGGQRRMSTKRRRGETGHQEDEEDEEDEEEMEDGRQAPPQPGMN
jgi:hypothetical protein